MSIELPILPDLRLEYRAPDVEAPLEVAVLLADRARSSILALLADGPHCVCEMAAALGARENNVSKHRPRLLRTRCRGLCNCPQGARGSSAMTTLVLRRPAVPFWAWVVGGALLWLVAWFITLPLANWVAYELLGLEQGSQLGDALAFFLYDVPKVLLLLTGIVTIVSFLRSFVSPERVRRALAGRGVLPGTLAAAGFGTVTPFCSCSAVPLFIGFVEAGVPLGVTFAFLIASPMVNEIAIVLLWGLFGPGVALMYMAAGLTVAVVAGLVIGRLHLERYVEDYVWKIHSGGGQTIEMKLTLQDRVRDAWASTRNLVWKVLPFVLVGIGIGAIIHGFVPTELVVSIGGSGNPLAVPALVLLGVPLYSNAAGTIPIIEVLIAKGLPMGSALAFMMAITALSFPEMVILRRVMRPQLIAVFAGVVAAGILFVGYLFNALYA
jgi:uncharacterized membrane protein YraQ (UPF0718 family)